MPTVYPNHRPASDKPSNEWRRRAIAQPMPAVAGPASKMQTRRLKINARRRACSRPAAPEQEVRDLPKAPAATEPAAPAPPRCAPNAHVDEHFDAPPWLLRAPSIAQPANAIHTQAQVLAGTSIGCSGTSKHQTANQGTCTPFLRHAQNFSFWQWQHRIQHPQQPQTRSQSGGRTWWLEQTHSRRAPTGPG